MQYYKSDNGNDVNKDVLSSTTYKKNSTGFAVTHFGTSFSSFYCKEDFKEVSGMEDNSPPKAKETHELVKKILANWKYIKQNIDPIPLLNELHKRNMLSKTNFHDLGDKRRSHQTTLVLLATCKKIQVEEDFQKFKESIRVLSSRSAEKMDLPIQQRLFKLVKTLNEERDLLEQNRSALEGKLHPDDLLTVLDDFVETFVFDLNTVEKIMADFPSKKSNHVFVNMVLSHLEKGSFTCLINNLLKVRNHRRFQHLTNATFPATAVNSGFEATARLIIDLPANHDVITAIKGDSAIQKDCEKLLHMKIKNITSGSIIFHLRTVCGLGIQKVTRDAIHSCLDRLFRNEYIKSKLSKHQEQVNWTFIADDDIINFDTCNLGPHDTISVNRSFLINEISVSTLISSFSERGVTHFDHIEGDKGIDRLEKARRFIDKLLDQRENVLELFWEILKENEMTYVLKRLDQCKQIYKSYSTGIENCILDNEYGISDELEFVMIRDTFEERKLFPASFFNDVEQRFVTNDQKTIYTLKKILKKGHFATMTLVDVLYINNCDALGENLLSGFKTAKKETSIETPRENIYPCARRTIEKAQLKGTYLLDIRDKCSDNSWDSQDDKNRIHLDEECTDDILDSQDIPGIQSDDDYSDDLLDSEDVQLRNVDVMDRPVTNCSITSNSSSNRTESGYGTDKYAESRTNSISTIEGQITSITIGKRSNSF